MAVRAPKGELYNIEFTQKRAKEEAEKFHGSSWADIENYGYRCVRVTVREELGR